MECLKPAATPNQIRLAGVAVTALVDGLWLELCLDASTFTTEEAVGVTKLWVETLLRQLEA